MFTNINPQGKVKYWPIGDDDEYDWQCKGISEIELYDIISEKVAKKEQVGINRENVKIFKSIVDETQ